MLVSGVIFALAAPAFQEGDGEAPRTVTELRSNPAIVVARGVIRRFTVGGDGLASVSRGVFEVRTGRSTGGAFEHVCCSQTGEWPGRQPEVR